MSALPAKMIERLTKVAEVVADEKKNLHFFGLVHRTNAMHDRWDLLVSSDKLTAWSHEALKYIVEKLKKVGKLPADDMVRIARIVALPPNNKVIDLIEDERVPPGKLSVLHHADRFDQALVIWPKSASHVAARH